jgi:hypothetical protein
MNKCIFIHTIYQDVPIQPQFVESTTELFAGIRMLADLVIEAIYVIDF